MARCLLVLGLALSPGSIFAQQPDVLTVDVEAVDGNGQPVAGLTPEAFEVSVGGQPRQVVSARFIAPGSPAAAPAPTTAENERVLVLAIDASSFSAVESLGVAVAAQGLVDRVPRADRVSVFTYPSGPHVDPTTDRAAIRQALEAVTSQAERASGTSFTRTLAALGGLLPDLAASPGRKVVVVISAASIAAGASGDSPGADDSPIRISQRAAESNAVIYTLFVGRGLLDMTIPHKIDSRAPAARQDDEMVEVWLAELSGRAGGALIKIAGANPVPAFSRILAETAAVYRLGIAPAADDRDGRLRALGVKARQSGTIVRGPSWLFVPAAGTATTAAAPAVVPAPARVASAANPGEPLDSILEAFERGEYAAVKDRLAQTPDLPRWIRGFRTARPPWPETPRRVAVLAIEIAAVALSTDQRPAVAETLNLLLQQSHSLRGGGEADGFECEWYWAGLMLFEGGYAEEGEPFAQMALTRCPGAPRIVLADAVLADQRSPVLTPAIRTGPAAAREAAAHQAVIDRYELARKFPETEFEARIREAWLLHRLKRFDEALALTDDLSASAAPVGPMGAGVEFSAQVQHVSYFVRAQVLRERRDFDAAADAYRRAIDAWPDGQSARVSMMTLLATRGQREDAEALAAAIEDAPRTAVDPWRLFWEGDRLLYPALVAKLREALR